MTADEIRDRFLKFFEERGHKIYPSDSLVPANDPSLLFTGTGMNQFKQEFLGRVKGPRRAATCQKCLRTGDLENVGKTPDHHTFFEMLGNFSFGDYFKKEAIEWAWEFLTKELGLKEKDLWVSVYKDDSEAYDIWKNEIKVPTKKILKLGEKDNFWPASAPSKGPNGPCGPCSEIFYGGPDGVEIWNLVFTQFDRKDHGKLDPLPGKNIDTGMGLERITRVMQGKKTNFEIDSFEPIVKKIEGFAGSSHNPNTVNTIADHIRAVTFAIGDGVSPSNEERAYVIRKLIRKASWHGRAMDIKEPFLYKLVPVVAGEMKRPYPELTQRGEYIAQEILEEEKRFSNVIQAGQERLKEVEETFKSKGVLPGKAIFKLYDTYGFPVELIQDIARVRGIKLDIPGFEKCMKDQRIKSRASSKIKGSIFKGDANLKLPDESIFVENEEELETEVVQVSGDSIFLKKTNFYGEKGGQVGDTGALIKDGKVIAEVTNAIDLAGRIEHQVKMKTVALKPGDKVVARIDVKRRGQVRENHTATHLLHNALRKVLGQHVKQAGSLVAPDHLRFDFTHFKALTGEELSRVEDLVNERIKEDSLVCVKELLLEEAKKQGVIALFGEKYADTVRMVSVGEYSKELCGGTHVRHTGEIIRFKILSESSIAGGVRRIEAVTGDAANKKIQESIALVKEIAKELKTSPDNILKEIEKLTKRLKKIEKDLNIVSDRFASSSIDGILKDIKKIKGRDVIVAEISNVDMAMLRKTADTIKGRIRESIFVLVSEKDGKLSMVVRVQAGMDAVKVLNEIGSSFGIKGGGRPDFAQAGARANIDIKKILKKAQEVLKEHL
ncbi:MAG: alanine--tRNA ligase [Candidatus Gorgyraea atricola]|nr:alanine--tRNA ligase [Candidatus Gorgyraea atricola]